MAPTLTRTLGLCLLAASLAAGCGPKTVRVAVPPRIDLLPYGTIGIVDFSSRDEAGLDQTATQRFMSVIQSAQPGVRFLELGPERAVLARVGRDRVDAETARLVGAHFGVDTLFTGAYEVSGVTPRVSVTDFTSVSASARVKLTLTVKHWDAKSGATIWTDSRWGEWSLGGFTKTAGVGMRVSVSDPRERYGVFVSQLVDAVTGDFQVRYEDRPIAD